MTLSTQRLDKYLSNHCQISKGDVRQLLAKGIVQIDGIVEKDIARRINKFSKISLDGKVLQDNQAHYVMLHKPKGVVCATTDKKHQTVIDILPFAFKTQLHIVGRLDLNTSGLVLLTNDSRWSEAITQPQQKIAKVYQVTLENPADESYIAGFAQGMYFEYENITTQPAQLTIQSPYKVEVTLTEGKYHQIKRMFGRFRNPVIELHRSQIGKLALDPELKPGQSRHLTKAEMCLFSQNS